MADSDSFGTCPTNIIHATPERVWDLLANPAQRGWLGAKVVEAPARSQGPGAAKEGGRVEP